MVDEESIPEDDESQDDPEDNSVDDDVHKINDSLRESLDPVFEQKVRKIQGLQERRERKEISPYDFDHNFLFQLNEMGAPLTRRDLQHESGEQAVVLFYDDFESIGALDFIHASGERMVIDVDSLNPDDVLIVYPEEVGEEEQ